jgi:hypothetical protein
MFCGMMARHRSAQGRADGVARRPYYENCQACFFWFVFYQFIGDSVQADGWDTRKEMSAKEVGVGRVSGGLPWRG